MRKKVSIIFAAFLAVCCSPKPGTVEEGVAFASKQLPYLYEEALPRLDSVRFIPYSVLPDGQILYTTDDGWTSGFYPGTLWLMYDLTGDEAWAEKAKVYTDKLVNIQYLTWHHDIGFMIGDSYGQGLRLKNVPGYKEVMIQAARSLSQRYMPAVGTTLSWGPQNGTVQKKGWKSAVIIDNMMNLEILFEASLLSGDNSFRDIAVSHANTTMKNHFRPDYSSYHVLDYDPETGEILHRQTAQGYSDESAWSRGQAWGLYGYTMCYRYTRDEKYLEQARNIAKFILTNRNMPEDLVPYWDFDCPDIPDTPRDVSSACIIASALYELHTFTKDATYKDSADRIILSLSGPEYRNAVGSNHGFLFDHSVGSIPHGVEIDKPLNYADYYYLEALCRKRDIENN